MDKNKILKFYRKSNIIVGICDLLILFKEKKKFGHKADTIL